MIKKVLIAIVVIFVIILASQLWLGLGNWFFDAITSPCGRYGGYWDIGKKNCDCAGLILDTSCGSACFDDDATYGCLGIVSNVKCYDFNVNYNKYTTSVHEILRSLPGCFNENSDDHEMRAYSHFIQSDLNCGWVEVSCK